MGGRGGCCSRAPSTARRGNRAARTHSCPGPNPTAQSRPSQRGRIPLRSPQPGSSGPALRGAPGSVTAGRVQSEPRTLARRGPFQPRVAASPPPGQGSSGRGRGRNRSPGSQRRRAPRSVQVFGARQPAPASGRWTGPPRARLGAPGAEGVSAADHPEDTGRRIPGVGGEGRGEARGGWALGRRHRLTFQGCRGEAGRAAAQGLAPPRASCPFSPRPALQPPAPDPRCPPLHDRWTRPVVQRAR